MDWAIRPMTPHLSRIEHLAHHAECAIDICRLVDHFLHLRSYVSRWVVHKTASLLVGNTLLPRTTSPLILILILSLIWTR